MIEFERSMSTNIVFLSLPHRELNIPKKGRLAAAWSCMLNCKWVFWKQKGNNLASKTPPKIFSQSIVGKRWFNVKSPANFIKKS